MSEYFLLQIPYNSAFTRVECEFSRDTPKNNGLISIYGKALESLSNSYWTYCIQVDWRCKLINVFTILLTDVNTKTFVHELNRTQGTESLAGKVSLREACLILFMLKTFISHCSFSFTGSHYHLFVICLRQSLFVCFFLGIIYLVGNLVNCLFTFYIAAGFLQDVSWQSERNCVHKFSDKPRYGTWNKWMQIARRPIHVLTKILTLRAV